MIGTDRVMAMSVSRLGRTGSLLGRTGSLEERRLTNWGGAKGWNDSFLQRLRIIQD